MKTSLIIRDDLLEQAQKITGVKEKTAVIHLGLEELIKKAARETLIGLGGQLKTAQSPKRRRSK